jgi:hypothetical protein
MKKLASPLDDLQIFCIMVLGTLAYEKTLFTHGRVPTFRSRFICLIRELFAFKMLNLRRYAGL